MSLANHYLGVTKMNIERGRMAYAEAVAQAISHSARDTELTGTWNRSIQTFLDGDDVVVAPDISILQSNPLIRSSLPNGDYTVMFTEHRQGMVSTRDGRRLKLPVNLAITPPLAIAQSVGRLKDYI